MSGGTVSLQLNTGALVKVTQNGSFQFSNLVTQGSTYYVSVAAQPYSPSQVCQVDNGSGTATANVTNVSVVCSLPSPRFVYETSSATQISGYAVDPSTGALTQLASSPFASGAPWTMNLIAHPAGKFLYAVGLGSTSSYVYPIAVEPSTGALSALASQQNLGNSGNFSVAMSPGGDFLYVLDGQTSRLLSFKIDATTGTLTPAATSNVPVSTYAAVAMIDPAGRYLYLADPPSTPGGTNPIYPVAIDPVTGSATSLSGSPAIDSGGTSQGLVDPSGRLLVTATQAETLNLFRISPTGSLTATGTSIPIGTPIGSIDLDPTGRFLFVTSNGAISMFQVDASTPSLQAVSGSPYAVPGGATPPLPFPNQIAVDPTGQYVFIEFDVAHWPSASPGGILPYQLNTSPGSIAPVGTMLSGMTSQYVYTSIVAVGF
jgi:6-phosphogluconolactonase (cycloisomerase 2 family)